MSLDATRWAWQQQGLKSSEKLVLLALSDRVGEAMTAYPSIQRLVNDTGLNRKTIINCFSTLEEKGLIADTGGRVGETKSVKIYKLIGVQDRHESNTKNGTATGDENPESSAEIGTAKGSQKRDSLNPKQSQFYQEAVPFFPGSSTENGTQNLPRNLSGNLYKYLGELDFSKWPNFPSEQIWSDFKKHRKAKKASISQTVINQMAGELKTLVSFGVSVDQAIAIQIEAGWQGLQAEWILKRLGGSHATGQPTAGQPRENALRRIERQSREEFASASAEEAGVSDVGANGPDIWPQVGESGR